MSDVIYHHNHEKDSQCPTSPSSCYSKSETRKSNFSTPPTTSFSRRIQPSSPAYPSLIIFLRPHSTTMQDLYFRQLPRNRPCYAGWARPCLLLFIIPLPCFLFRELIPVCILACTSKMREKKRSKGHLL
ncbi:hypothetical protein CDAR_365551 [Caerostris darwini]|uniref:Uncharacterized protein n=1 Tax=Caerostris darwini TaxID=1538125 RepID=A0AAV4RE64_9ARAC|nr:hypothetical protein CDAR_365551 [Caerostris darwini]